MARDVQAHPAFPGVGGFWDSTLAEAAGNGRAPMAVKQRIRRELETRLETISRRVEKVRSDLERKSQPLALDWEEAAVTRENDEVLEGLEREGEEQIATLVEALQRLDAGTYGVCARCNGAIAAERLEALPQAIHCISCAS